MDLSDIDGSDCHSTNQKEILKEFRRPGARKTGFVLPVEKY